MSKGTGRSVEWNVMNCRIIGTCRAFRFVEKCTKCYHPTLPHVCRKTWFIHYCCIPSRVCRKAPRNCRNMPMFVEKPFFLPHICRKDIPDLSKTIPCLSKGCPEFVEDFPVFVESDFCIYLCDRYLGCILHPYILFLIESLLYAHLLILLFILYSNKNQKDFFVFYF